jgi:UDP-glucose 4-epimerase
MKALVFGATGLIGSQLVKKLLKEGIEVTGASRSPAKTKSPKYMHVNLDITKKEDFSKLNNEYDCVFNMAAHISPGYSTDQALPCLLVNALGTLNVLEFMVKRKISRLIHSSSVTVYGKPRGSIVRETSATNPIIVYGVSKLTAENYCNMYSALHDLNITILRYGSVYGPGLNQKTALPLFIEKALRDEDIYLYGNGMRSQDYVYVDDVIQSNLLSVEKGISGIFNIGSGIKTTMKELARTIVKVLDSKSKILFDPKKEQEFSIGIDIKKAKKELEYSPQFNLKKGLEKFKKTL